MASARARGVASMTPVSRTPLGISRVGVVYHDFGFGHCERRGTTQAIVASHEHAPGGPAGGLAAGVGARPAGLLPLAVRLAVDHEVVGAVDETIDHRLRAQWIGEGGEPLVRAATRGEEGADPFVRAP